MPLHAACVISVQCNGGVDKGVKYATDCYPAVQMRQVILSKMQVCMDPPLPEPGACLQIDGAGTMECQAPASNTYGRGRIGGINTGYALSSKIFLGSGYNGFG